jgi:hypothetical protein
VTEAIGLYTLSSGPKIAASLTACPLEPFLGVATEPACQASADARRIRARGSLLRWIGTTCDLRLLSVGGGGGFLKWCMASPALGAILLELVPPGSLGGSHGQPSQIAHSLRRNLGMSGIDRLLVSLLCQVVLSPILEEYTQVERCSRSLLWVLRGDYPLVCFHCPIVLALPIKGGTQVECYPRLRLSGSRLICILPYRTLRLAGGLSGRFFSLLTGFVPGVLKVVIALIDAFLLWRISQIC